jgi:hypothetical protein
MEYHKDSINLAAFVLCTHAHRGPRSCKVKMYVLVLHCVRSHRLSILHSIDSLWV